MRRGRAGRLAAEPAEGGRRTRTRAEPLRNGRGGLRRVALSRPDQGLGRGVSARQAVVHDPHAGVPGGAPRCRHALLAADGGRYGRHAGPLARTRPDRRPLYHICIPARGGGDSPGCRGPRRAGGCAASRLLFDRDPRSRGARRGCGGPGRRGGCGIHPPRGPLEPRGAHAGAHAAHRRGRRLRRSVCRARPAPLPPQRVGQGAQRLPGRIAPGARPPRGGRVRGHGGGDPRIPLHRHLQPPI